MWRSNILSNDPLNTEWNLKITQAFPMEDQPLKIGLLLDESLIDLIASATKRPKFLA